ncbi:GrpB family protein [Peribacillus muralis]|uniref:GrpB family protein n=1 Tax=Peribacillus muralis TaxID=264697 RepID=UPI001F4E685E|nr:GrpB family protein [Peribacillus muralis]MCK1994800.1 GrpB family protein [Peribacillus muralis]MCK2015373.1 GrpB family protein [Peribacillus muralis]
MRRVEVVAHKREWQLLFRDECESLRAVFGDELVKLSHIGSTAIPAIAAKPVIDILAVVRSIERVADFNEEMEKSGYDVRGENGIAGRRFFSKGKNERSHHVHMFQAGHEDIARHLAFRDYMLAHPQEAERYSQLKLSLAAEFPTDIKEYVNGKHAFIKVIDERAKRWVSDRDVF